jgi:hypothetical protein
MAGVSVAGEKYSPAIHGRECDGDRHGRPLEPKALERAI